jgi:Type IV secretion system pilin
MTNIFNIIKKTLTSKFVIIFILAAVFGIFSIGIMAQAQPINNIQSLKISNLNCIFYTAELQGCDKGSDFLSQLLRLMENLAPVVATVVIIFAGFEYFADSALKKTEASKTLTSAIIGLIVVYLARPITAVIGGTFISEPSDSPSKFFINPAPLVEFINKFIDILLQVSAIAAVVSIIFGGYEYINMYLLNAGKNQNKVAPFELIRNGVVGLLVVIFARPIVSLLQQIFGKSAGLSDVIKIDSTGKTTVVGELSLQSQPIINLVKIILSQFLIPLSSVAAVLSMILAGYFFFFSDNKEERVKTGRSMLTNAAIGLVVVLISATIIQLLIYFVRPTDFVNTPVDIDTNRVNITPAPRP